MRNLASVSAASLLFAIGCVTLHAEPPADPACREPNLAQGEAVFDPNAPAALAVKRAKTGHLLVRPTVNGREAGWFIFDTGAGICVISTPHAERFDLTPAGDIDAVGLGGSEANKLFRVRTVTIGPLTLKDHPVMTTDLSFLKAHLEEDIVGVLGYGVLSRCVAEIEIEAPRIALHDAARFVLPSGKWMPMSLEGRVPSITMTFEGHEDRFRLDTGANSAVIFYEPAVRKYDLLAGRELTDGKLGGVGGFVPSKKGTLKTVRVGELRQDDVPAEFALEAKGSLGETARAGKIGAGLLKHVVMYVDYAGERVAIVPRAKRE